MPSNTNNASTKNLVDYPKLLVHEIGHAFENALEKNSHPKLRWSLPVEMWNREGFLTSRGWQFGADNTNGEIFADMFVHWTYGRWNLRTLQVDVSRKIDFMNDHMSSSILFALN